jgi:hypothetical protein
MVTKTLFAVLAALALVTMACGITINVPVEQVKTGPTQTMTLDIGVPSESPANLKLEFGAGELAIDPGTSDALLQGTARFNVEDFRPEVSQNGSEVTVRSGDLEIRGFPSINTRNFVNEWNLQLGTAPMNLLIDAGAYQGEIELGGLSILNLDVNDGAADTRLEFSMPNLVEMDTLSYTTGASKVELSGLANANFGTMIFRSGAGDYTLDFSGTLLRDARVDVESGVSQVTIIVPEGVSVLLTFTGGLANVDMQGEWEKTSLNTYELQGSGPTLEFQVEMGAGNLVLRTSR